MSYFPVMSPEEFEDSYPEVHQQVCDELGMGFVPNLFRCVAAVNPELALSSWSMLRTNLCTGNLPRITKELIFSFVAHKKKCDYCHIAHHALALHHGFSGEDVKTIMNDIQQIKNPVLRAVIEFADMSVNNAFNEINQFYDKLVDLGFSHNEIAELMGMISSALYMVNIADSLAINIDQRFIDVVKKAA